MKKIKEKKKRKNKGRGKAVEVFFLLLFWLEGFHHVAPYDVTHDRRLNQGRPRAYLLLPLLNEEKTVTGQS
jgi:hypothetical protein